MILFTLKAVRSARDQRLLLSSLRRRRSLSQATLRVGKRRVLDFQSPGSFENFSTSTGIERDSTSHMVEGEGV